MGTIQTKQIRNIVLLGHSGSGKTSLTEAMLYITKTTDRLGTVAAGNTVSDYDPEEARRGFSLQASIAPVMWNDVKINILDTPGYFDFEGEVRQCIRVADAAVILVDGKSGIQVGTELAWKKAKEAHLPTAFFINRFDDNEARFRRVYDALRGEFGVEVCPLQIPIIDEGEVIGFANLVEQKMYMFDGKTGEYQASDIPDKFHEYIEEFRGMLFESIAQTSEELMNKYFEGEEITREEAVEAIHMGIIHGEIVPVFCGAATKLWGIKTFLDTIADSFPRPTARGAERILNADGTIGHLPIIKDNTTPSIFVFKTVADPFIGKMTFFRVMEGEVSRDTTLRNTTNGTQEKLGHIYTVRGKAQTQVDALACGDIGMTAKLTATNTNDTLTGRAKDIRFYPIQFPTPYYTRGIVPKAKGDEDKISQGITRLLEEDYTLRYKNNAETAQLTISGLGDMHLDVTLAKLKSRFGVSVDLTEPRIAYRETIRGHADVEGKHKKQSGGRGQYGHVKIRFFHGEEEGLTFSVSVVGGAVPKNFYPAVEKGLLDAMKEGVLAGYPMVQLAADLYDGSYHDVDSDELSFKIAASLAYKAGIAQAKPVILEPVGTLRVTVPDDYVGDVMGDLNKRRGRVSGIEPCDGSQTVVAEVPQSEMLDYVIALRAMTQGRGSFSYDVTRYDEVPGNIAQKIIDAAKRNA